MGGYENPNPRVIDLYCYLGSIAVLDFPDGIKLNHFELWTGLFCLVGDYRVVTQKSKIMYLIEIK